MQFKKIIGLYCENYMKHIHTVFCEIQSFDVNSRGIYSYQRYLKGKILTAAIID